MRQREKTGRAIVLAIGFFCILQAGQTASAKAKVLPTDVRTPSGDCVLVGVEGSYLTDAEEALARINEIRREACEEGFPNPLDPLRALSENDYVPLQWSSDLEYVARIRAAEAAVITEHTRPNGGSCFGLKSERGIAGNSETLAWSSSGSSMVDAVDQWYSEKEDWIEQSGAVTGHYTSMINPDARYVGMGLFLADHAAWAVTACGRFCKGEGLDTARAPAVKNCVQTIEIQSSFLKKNAVLESTSGKKINKLAAGDTVELALNREVEYGDGASMVRMLGNVRWTSSNTKVAVVDASGRVRIQKFGTAVIKAASADGASAVSTLAVLKPVSGLKLSAGKGKIKLRWKAVRKVQGYQIQYSENPRFQSGNKMITIPGAKKKQMVLNKLKSKRKYYIRIRTYAEVNGEKQYSAWSAKRSIKTGAS